MEEKYIPPKKVKVVVRRASPALKIALCLLIVFSMAALVALRWVHTSIRSETEKLTQEAIDIQQENDQLNDKIEALGSVQSVQDIAEEELGLVDPDIVVIDPQ